MNGSFSEIQSVEMAGYSNLAIPKTTRNTM